MKAFDQALFRIILVLTAIVLPLGALAEVTKVVVSDRHDVLEGKAWGNTGPYEKLTGKVYFAVDPNNSRNKIIVDIDKAPRNAEGKVEFSADLFILRPKDPSKSNGVCLFDVPNRGGKGALSTFNRAKGSLDPTAQQDFGDGLLLNEGYTIVEVGWESDIPAKPGYIFLTAPVATDGGKVITGWITPGPWFIPKEQADSYNYVSQDFAPTYAPLDLNDPEYRLTERPALVSAPTLVPRSDWQFAKMVDGKPVQDQWWITKKGGFHPGMVYQLTYKSQNPQVEGVGFAAVRDMASYVKNNPDAIVKGKYVYTYGSSQVGRWQRQFLYEGFTVDEQQQKAVDGLYIVTSGGTGLGVFNERFGMPDELGSYTQTKFPIRYEMSTDPVTGKLDGLGARVPAGLEPKIVVVDTESEIYDRGRDELIRTTSLDGKEDLPDPSNVRYFTMSGAKHGSGTWPPNHMASQQLPNDPLEYRWAERALLEDLNAWVQKGVEPPASLHPTLSDQTAILISNIKFPNVPGIQWPYHVPGGMRNDLPAGPAAVLPFLVPNVNEDGNITSGLRMPELAVPLGTYGGWAFRSEAEGEPNTLVSMAGSYIPFAKTKADRTKSKDPRLSLEERYPSRDKYMQRIQAAADQLVKGRYLRADDEKEIVEDAGKHWDWTISHTHLPRCDPGRACYEAPDE
jgi:hypothetical protein